jgi:hypothetical protein
MKKPSSDEYRELNQGFQHIARFFNVTTTVISHSYGRRSPVLQFKATHTSPFNIPALGRSQPPYIGFRLGGDLCFC